MLEYIGSIPIIDTHTYMGRGARNLRDLAQLEACQAHNLKDPGSKPGVASGEFGIYPSYLLVATGEIIQNLVRIQIGYGSTELTSD